jgi:lysozyme family protein
MADFSDCFPFVLANEDYTPPRYEPNSDPTEEDPDAQALSGINSAAWPQEFAFIASLPQDQRATAVQAFYFKNYWNQWYAQLVSNEVAKRVFDTAVNINEKKAVKLLQNAINGIVGNGSSYTVATDGAWGPQTLTAANGASDSQLVSAFKQLRVAHYQANDANSPYLAQLIARAEK